MTRARAVEYRITQQLLRRREEAGPAPRHRIVERLIALAAAGVAIALLGAVARELLWAVGACAVVVSLGIRDA
jgi:hypothetical protein